MCVQFIKRILRNTQIFYDNFYPKKTIIFVQILYKLACRTLLTYVPIIGAKVACCYIYMYIYIYVYQRLNNGIFMNALERRRHRASYQCTRPIKCIFVVLCVLTACYTFVQFFYSFMYNIMYFYVSRTLCMRI